MHDTLQNFREPGKRGDTAIVTDITKIPTFKNWCRSSKFKAFAKSKFSEDFSNRYFKGVSFNSLKHFLITVETILSRPALLFSFKEKIVSWS